MASDFEDRASSADENDFDVVIVGAGITGLAAAYYILQKKAGISILVLEGNDSIGGRLLTPAESESYFAHPLQTHITNLLDSLQIPKERRREISHRSRLVYMKQGLLREELPRHTAQQVCHFLKMLETSSKNKEFGSYDGHEDAEELARISIDSLLCSLLFFPQARSLCRSLIYATCGIKHIAAISALWFMVMLHGAGGLVRRLRIAIGDENRYFVKGGMAKLVEQLVRRITQEFGELSCSEPVLKIQFNDDRTYVLTNRRIIKCDYVIIAVPPSENAEIDIDPPLPDNILKSQHLHEHGDNIFFTVKYNRPFWYDRYTGDVMATLNSQTNLRLAYDATHPADNQVSVIAGFLSKPNIVTPENFDLFHTLSRCFRSDEASRHIGYTERLWMPYDFFQNQDGTGGGGSPMSVMKPSHIAYHINAMLQPHGRVYFAASEYSRTWPGTVDGAVEAGRGVACTVLMNIRPQAVNLLEISSYIETKHNVSGPALPIGIVFIQSVILGFHILIFRSFLRDAYRSLI